jgi:hypothetical protein
MGFYSAGADKASLLLFTIPINTEIVIRVEGADSRQG